MTGISKEALAALDPLLDQVLDLEPDEREIWFAALRLERPVLAGELESLLGQESLLEERGFLSGDGYAGMFDGAPSLIGLQIGAYTLEEPIGQGGMGSVWLGRRSDGRFKGKAAVKLLNLALVDPIGVERFRREGTVLAQLTHPNIARMLDAGLAEAGQPYLVLEYVEGQRIDLYCDRHQLDPLARLALFRQVAGAVAHAHANLIVHRDLKPSNILVSPDGNVKLLDFGIAKLLESEASGAERSELTARGGLAFTPEYAAPEQVLGGPITTATDVYSLGVLLYLLLAGRHPTSGGSVTTAGHLSGILDTEPPRLSVAVGGASSARLKRLYRGDLDNILAKALKKEPAQRYPTVTALADDLERHLRHEPVQARPDSYGYRARKFVRRNRAAVLVSSLTAAALVVATVVTASQMVEARKQRDEAVFQARRGKAQMEFQTLLLSSLGPKPLTAREILDRGRVLLEREWIGEPRFTSGITLNLASHYRQLGDNQKEAELLARAESLALHAGAADMLVPVRCAQVSNIHHRDSTARALALLDRTRSLFSGADRSDVAGCLLVEADIAYFTDRADTAVILGRRALGLLDSLGDTTGMQYIGALNSLANALENSGRGREAIMAYERINDVLDRSGRRESVFHSVITNNIGIALSNLGEMNAAEPVLRGTVEEFQRSDPTGFVHPAILVNYNRTMLFLRKLDTAGFWYDRMVSQAAAQRDVEMQQTGHYGLALVEAMRGRLSEAARHAEQAKRFGATLAQPRFADNLTLAGVIATARGNPTAGLASLEAALRHRGYYEGKRTYPMRAELVFAAEAALASSNAKKAIEYARAARDVADVDSLTGTRSAYVGEAALLESRGLLLDGDSVAARHQARMAQTALTFGAGAEHPRTLEAASLSSRLATR